MDKKCPVPEKSGAFAFRGAVLFSPDYPTIVGTDKDQNAECNTVVGKWDEVMGTDESEQPADAQECEDKR